MLQPCERDKHSLTPGGGGGSGGPSRTFWHYKPPSPNKASAVSRTIDALFGDDHVAASRRRPVLCLGQWTRVETMAQTMAQPFKLAIRLAINHEHYLSCFFRSVEILDFCLIPHAEALKPEGDENFSSASL